MIDGIGLAPGIASALPRDTSDTTSPARGAGAAMIDALTAGTPIGTSLMRIAGEAAAELSTAPGRGDPVAVARLERATLDFGREAKAFAIGHADRGPASVRATLDDALATGAAEAMRLEPLGLDPLDRAVLTFERAAACLDPAAANTI